jgi:hypothetical protein
VGKPEGKRPLGRPKRRWVDNIKMDLREIEWDGMDWIDLVQDRDQTAGRYIPEDRTLYNRRCENLSSHNGDVSAICQYL